jgi:hypothetical protein
LKTPIGAGCSFCSACFNAEYPMAVPFEGDKFACGNK